ncbi:MAG: winged helix-turn-helix domain-containing protein [Candidatus Bathyarchaeota archaeon]|nr:winged helix-turn-helix domain-containing protein [Candidatus Bathyarchaeota archaeon]
MNSGLDSLHKILKDENRRKIVLLLNEKGSLSYTDLMDMLGIVRTGTLNYHLKVLGDLLAKNETGHYVLTEKGKLSSRLLIEFPEPDYALQEKRKWWRRFWIAAILLQSAGLAVALALYSLEFLDFSWVVRSIFGYIFGILFLYFFYRMIRPQKDCQKYQPRTVEDVLVSGRSMQEVRTEVLSWVREEAIKIEIEREDFIRGRLGIPSGLGLTAPKYFEVTLKPVQNGVMVHTEGWISLYDVSERSFSNRILVSGNIPRRKGWKVISNLWKRLRTLSR